MEFGCELNGDCTRRLLTDYKQVLWGIMRREKLFQVA